MVKENQQTSERRSIQMWYQYGLIKTTTVDRVEYRIQAIALIKNTLEEFTGMF